jgi:hypothetical protein
MSGRNREPWKRAQKCGGYNDTGNVHKLHTRFGEATLTYGDYEGHYQSMWYEGPSEALFWLVGKGLNDTSTCYEHTFQVVKIEITKESRGMYEGELHQHLKVTCKHTSYVGD